MGEVKCCVVTRDEVELNIFSNATSVVVWEERADPKLNEKGFWEWGDAQQLGCIAELSPERFKEEYNLHPPGIGAKKIMKISYEWEEE